MGNQSSKKKDQPTHRRPPLPENSPNRTDSDSEAAQETTPEVDLSSYETACQEDSQLRSLDADLQKRASKAINSVAIGLEVGSTFSLDSLREVTECLLEMNQEVVNIIFQSKKDIWNNPELFDLVNDYFENSLQSLDFCAALEACLKRALHSHSILEIALQKFDDEFENPEKANYYSKTLEELRNFKAAGDPFTKEFFTLFQGVYKQQIAMLEKLQAKMKKLDKELGNVKAWKKVTNAIFVVAFISALIVSVVAAAVSAPPVVTAVAAAVSVPIGSMGKWLSYLWSKWEKDLKGQKEIIFSMEIGSYAVIKDLDSIRILVDKLEIEIEALVHNAEFALEEEEDESVAIGVEEIKKKVDAFMKTLQDLSERSDKCSRDINRTRTVILRKIIKYPTSSDDQGNGNILFSS